MTCFSSSAFYSLWWMCLLNARNSLGSGLVYLWLIPLWWMFSCLRYVLCCTCRRLSIRTFPLWQGQEITLEEDQQPHESLTVTLPEDIILEEDVVGMEQLYKLHRWSMKSQHLSWYGLEWQLCCSRIFFGESSIVQPGAVRKSSQRSVCFACGTYSYYTKQLAWKCLFLFMLTKQLPVIFLNKLHIALGSIWLLSLVRAAPVSLKKGESPYPFRYTGRGSWWGLAGLLRKL